MLSGLIPPTTRIGRSLGMHRALGLEHGRRCAFGREKFERGRTGIERSKGVATG